MKTYCSEEGVYASLLACSGGNYGPMKPQAREMGAFQRSSARMLQAWSRTDLAVPRPAAATPMASRRSFQTFALYHR